MISAARFLLVLHWLCQDILPLQEPPSAERLIHQAAKAIVNALRLPKMETKATTSAVPSWHHGSIMAQLNSSDNVAKWQGFSREFERNNEFTCSAWLQGWGRALFPDRRRGWRLKIQSPAVLMGSHSSVLLECLVLPRNQMIPRNTLNIFEHHWTSLSTSLLETSFTLSSLCCWKCSTPRLPGQQSHHRGPRRRRTKSVDP